MSTPDTISLLSVGSWLEIFDRGIITEKFEFILSVGLRLCSKSRFFSPHFPPPVALNKPISLDYNCLIFDILKFQVIVHRGVYNKD